ncbi:Pfs, NACHT and ankyrin domain protein [Trichoderma novae-zelandiae]
MAGMSPPPATNHHAGITITHVRASLSNDLLSHSSGAPTLQHSDYTVGWICALHIEMAAARAMLDCVHKPLPMGAKDSNAYLLGNIGPHNVALACLPVNQYGTNNAANVASNMNRSFPSIRIRLMVGIGGGVPSQNTDVRLGDVVVGCRIMQYDMGKVVADGETLPTGIPRITPPDHSTHISSLRAVHEMKPSRVPAILQEMHRKHPGMTKYAYPTSPDRLFRAAYEHVLGAFDCSTCSEADLVARPPRMSPAPMVHHGGIASGNTVMKHADSRDKMAQAFDVICFEMEAAGLMDYFPCLVIRGICDYADSHKNKQWQEYAAAAAAAYAKELLEEMPSFETVHYVSGDALRVRDTDATSRGQDNNFDTRQEELLNSLRFDQIGSRQSNIEAAHEETCSWFLEHPTYLDWLNTEGLSTHYGILWLSGKPGAGKSTIMKFLYTHLEGVQDDSASAIVSFFFNARGELLEKSTTGMFRSLLLQLLETFPDLQSVLDDFSLVPKDKHGCPPTNIVRKLFRNAVLLLDARTLTCVIDALDECDEQQVRDMVGYFEDLGREAIKRSIQLRISFSSRHYPYISIEHALRLTLEDQQGHGQDMERYVQSRFKPSPDLFGDVQAQILHKAAGVFMWVVLVVNLLNLEFDRGRIFAVRKRLRELPAGLSDLFKNILRRDGDNMQELLLCIQWILYAKRPLKPAELYFALLSGSPDDSLSEGDVSRLTSDILEKFVISSSKGLAEVTRSTHPTVQFIHESISDFLLKDGGLLELWPDLSANIEASSHDTLKQCCHAYFRLCAPTGEAIDKMFLERKPATLRKAPFLEYAVSHMLYHADMAAREIPQNEFLSQLTVRRFVPLSRWFVAEYDLLPGSSDASLVYILAAEGLAHLIRAWPLQASHLNVPGGQFRYPLFAALIYSHRDAVRALLGWDASSCHEEDLMAAMRFEVQYAITRSQTPLHWVVTNNREMTVRQLLKMGASIDARDRNGNTALLLALFHGHEAIAKLLIEAGADIHARDNDGQTALLIAVRFDHEESARVLVKRGSDVDVKDYYGNTALKMARLNENGSMIQLLMEAGADAGDDSD